ncbi:transcription factor bHLH [Forsythia ovata]|uniref:Transcription factor bHLH n=1 Tax=Forsythia ovata TaxID=205694 RepID=A0ABD1R6P2_9LAMI
MPIAQSLVLDNEKEKLVKTSEKKSGISEVKKMMALKKHSESEKRRRERINDHLITLRGLVPSNEKMDKAMLLAEVISQVKQLQKNAAQSSEGLNIPLEFDEVKVEKLEGYAGNGSSSFRASLCCDYRPDLFSELRRALDDLPVHLVKAETSTLGGRTKNVFVFTSSGEGKNENTEARELISSVRGALSNIVNKASASAKHTQELYFPRKRQRVSYFDSSSSSS